MTPKFSNKGSLMTPKNSGLAETLMMAYFNGNWILSPVII